MSLSKPDTLSQIVPELIHDARINYKPWPACIFAIAASQCQSSAESLHEVQRKLTEIVFVIDWRFVSEH
jgi:hypothetical protein